MFLRMASQRLAILSLIISFWQPIQHCAAASADELIYTIEGTSITIQECPTNATGELIIPDTINGLKVTTIAAQSFRYCTLLNSIHIPDSVKSIGDLAFADCSSLISINIPDSVSSIGYGAFKSCSSLTSINIPDSVTYLAKSTFGDCNSLTSIKIPNSLTYIEVLTFENCSSLTSINIPDSVSYIGYWAFSGCSSLTSIYFLGDGLDTGSGLFDGCDEVTIYILADSTGFTTPSWQYRPVVVIGTEELPADSWLQLHGRAPHADLSVDDTGDGVSLLMARALNLRPDENLAGKMPKPQIYDGSLGLMFHGQSKGVDYLVESSSDLVNWSSQNVNLSEPDADGMRVAEASTEGEEKLFIRLTVNASELD